MLIYLYKTIYIFVFISLFFIFQFMYPLKIKEKYNPENLEATSHRFSVVYLWTYISWDFKEWVWSHPAVDIIPETKNQDVFAPLDGTVYKSWEDGAYGKYIIIEHTNVPNPDDMKKTTTLYSWFQHLSEVKVKDWQNLKEGDVIGKTWNTGNSFWEHLHFQIDRQEAPFHSYWPFTWAEARDAWTTFSGWVSMWLGKDKARMYTVNPLVYLDKVEEYRKNGNNSTQNDSKVNTKPIIEEKITLISQELPLVKSSEIIQETLLNSQNTENITPVNYTSHTNEKKIDIVHFDDNIILKDPAIDALNAQLNGESQKKNLKI